MTCFLGTPKNLKMFLSLADFNIDIYHNLFKKII